MQRLSHIIKGPGKSKTSWDLGMSLSSVQTYYMLTLSHNYHLSLLITVGSWMSGLCPMLLGVWFQFPDSYTPHEVNKKNSALNNKPEKLVRVLPHARFIYSNDRNLYTKDGLHHNKLGKMFISLQLVEWILTIFAHNSSTPIPLRSWTGEIAHFVTLHKQLWTGYQLEIGKLQSPGPTIFYGCHSQQSTWW
jgi:hypothetical protein